MKKLLLSFVALASVAGLEAKKPARRRAVAVAPAPAPVDHAKIAADAARAAEAAKVAAEAAEAAKNPFADILKGFEGIESGSMQQKLDKLDVIVTKIDTTMNKLSKADIKGMSLKQKQSMAISLNDLSGRITAILKEYMEGTYWLPKQFTNSDPIVDNLFEKLDLINKHYVKINPGHPITQLGRFAYSWCTWKALLGLYVSAVVASRSYDHGSVKMSPKTCAQLIEVVKVLSPLPNTFFGKKA